MFFSFFVYFDYLLWITMISISWLLPRKWSLIVSRCFCFWTLSAFPLCYTHIYFLSTENCFFVFCKWDEKVTLGSIKALLSFATPRRMSWGKFRVEIRVKVTFLAIAKICFSYFFWLKSLRRVDCENMKFVSAFFELAVSVKLKTCYEMIYL